MVKEPVSNSRILDDGSGTASPGVSLIWADEMCQLRPLEISCTVSEEGGGQTNGVNQGDESTPLPEPVLLGATQTSTIVQYMVGECFSLLSHHDTKLLQ